MSDLDAAARARAAGGVGAPHPDASARAGRRRAAALRQYQACVDVLQREFGAEPEPETRRLYLELLRAPDAPGTTPARARPAVEGSPLIGRETELAALNDGVATALGGGGPVLVVHGEAGVGKTRIVDALMTEHERRGTRTRGAPAIARPRRTRSPRRARRSWRSTSRPTWHAPTRRSPRRRASEAAFPPPP